MFLRTIVAWLFTLLAAGLVSAALFAAGGFSPSIIAARDVAAYESDLRTAIEQLAAALDSANARNNATLGPAYFNGTLSRLLGHTTANLTNWYNSSVQGYLPPADVLRALRLTLSLYRQNSVVTVGFNTTAARYSLPTVAVPH